jgi:hypothetical protein
MTSEAGLMQEFVYIIDLHQGIASKVPRQDGLEENIVSGR